MERSVVHEFLGLVIDQQRQNACTGNRPTHHVPVHHVTPVGGNELLAANQHQRRLDDLDARATAGRNHGTCGLGAQAIQFLFLVRHVRFHLGDAFLPARQFRLLFRQPRLEGFNGNFVIDGELRLLLHYCGVGRAGAAFPVPTTAVA